MIEIHAVLEYLREQEKVTTALVVALLKDRARNTTTPKKATKKR